MTGPGPAFHGLAFGRQRQLRVWSCNSARPSARLLPTPCLANGAKRRSFMKPRVKRVAIFALKIAILVGLLEYARRQSQIADEIAVLAPGANLGGELVGGGIRLKVVGDSDTARAPLEYRVATPTGKEVLLSPNQLDASPRPPPSQPP